jgi:phospholipase C
MVTALMQSDAWPSSAFMWAHDDWGGWYDHVPPPQVDKFGYGFRVPALLVSPYARQGAVDSTILDHTSVLRFIESNWGLAPLAERDAAANSIANAFDFTQPPRQAAVISMSRTPPAALVIPDRSAIYAVYAAATGFAALMVFFALLSPESSRIRLRGLGKHGMKRGQA